MKVYFATALSFLVSTALAETQLETYTVTDSPESALLSEDIDTLQQGATNSTLGGYLDSMSNVDSASYGEAVGRPVVRGMSGYRVKILHNDQEVTDLSAMSQDHAVAVAPRAAERIELLKGPASLLYAARAGGVIRISDALDAPFPEVGFSGELAGDFRFDPDSHGLDAQLALANEHWALRLGGLRQASDPYVSGDGVTIPDSDLESQQGQIGLGWQPGPNSEWQINATFLEKDYGIPNETPAATRINMEREDVGIKWRYYPESLWLNEITADVLNSDYLHDETEGGRKDGLFGQQQQSGNLNLSWGAGGWLGESRFGIAQNELRVCHEHGACGSFSDAVRTGAPLGESLQLYYENSGLPFSHGHPMPDTESQVAQGSSAAQLQLNEMNKLSLGLHWEMRELNADPKNIQEQWVYPSALDADYYGSRNDQAFSFSLGFIRSATENVPAVEVSLSYLERFPSVDELFWNGFHHATDSYIFGDVNLDSESSVNLDLDLTWDLEAQRWQLSTFYYRFQDYIYQDIGYSDDGLALIDPFHLSDVWFTRQTDANFLGGSLRYERYFSDTDELPLTFWAQADLLDASRANGEHLPRTAPATAELGIRYEPNHWYASLSLKHVFQADKLAPKESATASYNWLSMYLQRDWHAADQTFDLWVKAENLLDELAQNHLSVLKDTAPLPGRQVSAGISWRF